MPNYETTTGCVGCAAAMLVISVPVIMCSGWLSGGIHYSDGFREGRIQKISAKGIIWTTHEGEMALPGLRMHGSGDDAQVSNTWEFSVNNPEIAKQLKDIHEDELVRLHYSQYLFSPPWKGNTGYFITKVEKVKRHP